MSVNVGIDPPDDLNSVLEPGKVFKRLSSGSGESTNEKENIELKKIENPDPSTKRISMLSSTMAPIVENPCSSVSFSALPHELPHAPGFLVGTGELVGEKKNNVVPTLSFDTVKGLANISSVGSVTTTYKNLQEENEPNIQATEENQNRPDIGFEGSDIAIFSYFTLMEALYSYGSLSEQLHKHSSNVTTALNLEDIHLRLEPSGLSFMSKRKQEFVYLSRGVNINKLIKAERLSRKVSNREINCEFLLAKLESIHSDKNPYHPLLRILAFPFYSVGFSVFFYGGGWKTVCITLILGFYTGVYDFLQNRGYMKRISYLTTFINTFIPGFVVGALVHFKLLNPNCAYPTAFGPTAVYFPGVTLSFAVLDILKGFLLLGGIRVVYAVITANLISTALSAGFAFWYSLVGSTPDHSAYPSCESLIAGGETTQNLVRCAFYVPVYLAAILFHNIPIRLSLLFLLTQGTSYFIYFVLENQTKLGNYLSTGIAVFSMVMLAALLSSRYVRKFKWFRLITPMGVIIPSVELFVPGTAMVKSGLAVSTGASSSTDLLSLNQSILLTAFSIVLGFLFSESFLQLFVPSIGSTLLGPQYRGPYNHWELETALDKEKVMAYLPDFTMDYIIIIIHKGGNLAITDTRINNDPYVKISVVDDVEKKKVGVGRSTTKYDNFDPEWEEAFILPIVLNDAGQMNFKIDVMNFRHFRQNELIGTLDCEINYFERKLSVNGKSTLNFQDMQPRQNEKPALPSDCFKLESALHPESFLKVSFGYQFLEGIHEMPQSIYEEGYLRRKGQSSRNVQTKLNKLSRKVTQTPNSLRNKSTILTTGLAGPSLRTRTNATTATTATTGTNVSKTTNVTSVLASRLTRRRTDAENNYVQNYF